MLFAVSPWFMVSFSTCDRSPVQPQPPHVPLCPQATTSLFPCLCSPSPLHYTLIGPQLMVLTAFQLKKCHPLHLPLLLSNRVYCHCCSPTQPHPFRPRPPSFSSKLASPSCCPSLPSPLHLCAPSQTPAPTVLQPAGLTTKCELQGKRHSLATTDGDSGDSGLLQVVQLHFLGQEGWKKEDSSSARGVMNHEGIFSL